MQHLVKRDQHERDMVLAWHTAAIALSGFGGKMPKLDTLLPQRQIQKQTPGQMRAVLSVFGLRSRRMSG